MAVESYMCLVEVNEERVSFLKVIGTCCILWRQFESVFTHRNGKMGVQDDSKGVHVFPVSCSQACQKSWD